MKDLATYEDDFHCTLEPFDVVLLGRGGKAGRRRGFRRRVVFNVERVVEGRRAFSRVEHASLEYMARLQVRLTFRAPFDVPLR